MTNSRKRNAYGLFIYSLVRQPECCDAAIVMPPLAPSEE